MTKINENTATNGSPGTKGYTGYVPKQKYTQHISKLAKIIKKTTGYDMVDFEPISVVNIENDNDINKSDITDINISTTKRHKELEKDFKKQMKESLPRLKDLVL
tara:strand:- start:26 stop:337 length:312 start_codon:yes stop_codon:yes gene_type:complete